MPACWSPPDEGDEDQDAPSPEDEDGGERSRGPVSRSADTDVEGVFIVVDGHVTFAPVEVGITGQEHFEILSGVSEGDTIVAGPYQQIRQLSTGDAVKAQDDRSGNGSS